MGGSSFEATEIRCRSCGRPTTHDVWLIVDAAERPDLLQQALFFQLHEVRCEHCGHTDLLNAPLLLYRPDHVPSLIFLAPAAGSAERERAVWAQLMSRLAATLAEGALENQPVMRAPAWLLPTIVMRDVGADLDEVDVAGLRRDWPQAADAYLNALAEYSEVAAQGAVTEAVQAVGSSGDLRVLRLLIRRHPALLRRPAHELLSRLAEAAVAEHEIAAARMLQQLETLLARCRAVGVEAALAEQGLT